MNTEQKEALNYQAKHKARKAIDWNMLGASYRDDIYWSNFYAPISDFLGLCTKRELIFLVVDKPQFFGFSEDGLLSRKHTKQQLLERMLGAIRTEAKDLIGKLPQWMAHLQSRMYFIAENGHGIKI